MTVADSLLAGLDSDQHRAVVSTAQPLCILAGAGSGKTRVLTRRIAHRSVTGDADPRHVLALTFTRKAAGELSDRLRRFGLRDLPAAGTFHAHAWSQLRTFWAGGDRRPPALLERRVGLLNRIVGRGGRLTAVEVLAEIEWSKARMVAPADYARAIRSQGRRPPAEPARIAGYYQRYEEEKAHRGVVDFDDLLARCANALDDDIGFAAAQRWRFRHLFVDEYQDVNPLQHRLLLSWLGDRLDLCVVGDPHQAIYGWNGADASFLTDFATYFPGAAVVPLGHNYRSSPQILAAAATVLAGDDEPARPLRSHRPDGHEPEIVVYETDGDEANGIARAVRHHHGPQVPWSAQAVLVRTNGQIGLIETALRRAGIPFRVRGAAAFLDEPVVAAAMKAIADGGGPFTSALADLDAEARRDASRTDEQQGALDALVRLGQEFAAAEPHAPASAFRPWLAAGVRSEGADRSANAVTVATFHAGKGLEWPVVHLAGLEDGFVPIAHARTGAAEAEERRLLYVALTRGERVVCCTWAAQRSFGDRDAVRSPSPYLRHLRLARLLTAPLGDSGQLADAGLAAARARLTTAAADNSLHKALLAWRARVARGAGVPDSVVLPDRTLTAVAERRPADPTALAGLPGVGPLKLAEHGETLLALVTAHRAKEHPSVSS